MDAAKHRLGVSSQNTLPIVAAAAAGIAATDNDAAATVSAVDVVVTAVAAHTPLLLLLLPYLGLLHNFDAVIQQFLPSKAVQLELPRCAQEVHLPYTSKSLHAVLPRQREQLGCRSLSLYFLQRKVESGCKRPTDSALCCPNPVLPGTLREAHRSLVRYVAFTESCRRLRNLTNCNTRYTRYGRPGATTKRPQSSRPNCSHGSASTGVEQAT